MAKTKCRKCVICQDCAGRRHAAVKRYRDTVKGKAALARAQAKYLASPKGRAMTERNNPNVMSENDIMIQRLSAGLPWPIPANEYANQERRKRDDLRALGVPLPPE